MLHLIKGRAGSGKTEYLRNFICGAVDSCSGILIVPEQFSFETERALLKKLGAQKVKKLSITSFSRLALSRLRQSYNFDEKRIADEGVKKALMSEALRQLEGELKIYSGKKAGDTLLTMLVDFNKELKFCRVSYPELKTAGSKSSSALLKDKTDDLALINEAYDALLETSYFDDSEAVERFCKIAAEEHFFAAKTVYIDGFRAFSKQELECLRIALCHAADVYITLCTDADRARAGSAFEYIKDFEIQLRSVAAQCGVSVDEICLEQNKDAFSADIFKLEQALYSRGKTESAFSDGSITVAECTDKRDECRYVAREIRRLLRAGYRCRDIAVIERKNGSYKSNIIAELKRAGIPVFDDSRRPLAYESLFVYIGAVLECVTEGFTTENVFRYLKSGLSPLSVDEISELENYSVIWKISGRAWLCDFTMHPAGFGSEFDEKAREKLNALNLLRSRAVNPLVKLKNACEDKRGGEICTAVYDFLVKENTPDRLYEVYLQLLEDGFPVEAERQRVSWDILMKLLDTCNSMLGEKCVSLARWFEIFNLLVSSKDIGEIPQGLDEVTVGSADRIRTESIKAAFLVGVNKNEFPLVEIPGGILTDNDRRILTKEMNVDIRPSFADAVSEERFITYCAVTAASEKLYISYRTVDRDGSTVLKSELCDAVSNTFCDFNTLRTCEMSVEERIETDDNAFSELAECYRRDCSERATLLEYFAEKNEYDGKLHSVELLTGSAGFNFQNPDISRRLFGDTVEASATSVERYYKCPFAFFMQNGLGVEELKQASYDALQNGSAIHLALEKILTEYPGKKLLDVDDGTLKSEIKKFLTEYLNTKMGGAENKTERFIYIYDSICATVLTIAKRMQFEMSVSDFEPHDFELKIGGDEIGTYNLPLDKGEVCVRGSVDRVDLYEKDGIKYLRVIDYKSGTKDFKLSELFSGINMQMVLYLMALVKNGKSYYGDTRPAAVLYVPAKVGTAYISKRYADENEIKDKILENGKLKGMVSDSPVVLNAMGIEKVGKYYPVSLKSNGEFTSRSNYFTQKHFNKISEKVDEKLIEMGNALHNGAFQAYPFGENGESELCGYCGYKAICGHEKGDAVNEALKLDHSEALEKLEVTAE